MSFLSFTGSEVRVRKNCGMEVGISAVLVEKEERRAKRTWEVLAVRCKGRVDQLLLASHERSSA